MTKFQLSVITPKQRSLYVDYGDDEGKSAVTNPTLVTQRAGFTRGQVPLSLTLFNIIVTPNAEYVMLSTLTEEQAFVKEIQIYAKKLGKIKLRVI